MTRAVPALLKAVPVQMTAEVRACGGMPVNGALGVPVGGDLLQTVAQDGTLARLQFVRRTDFTRRHILGEILQRGAVFHHPVLGGFEWLAVRRLKVRPLAFAAGDERRLEDGAHPAMSQTLAGIAGRDINVLRSWIFADESCIVDGVEHLTRPAM